MDAEYTSINDALRAGFSAQQPDAQPAQPAGGPTPVGDVVPPAPPAELAYAEPAPAPAVPDARLQKLVAQQQALRTEREAFKREQAQRETDMRELEMFRQAKARATEDPVGWAQLGGYDAPDKYAAAVVEKGAMTPERRALMEQRQQIEELKQFKQEYIEQQKQAEQQRNYSQFTQHVRDIAEQAGDAYDLVKRTGAYNLVLQKINDHYQATGGEEVLPYEMALEQAEQHLLETYASPIVESPKIRAKWSSAQQAPTTQSAPVIAPAARQRGTQNLRPASSPPRQLSEPESLEQAGRLLFKQFQLPQR